MNDAIIFKTVETPTEEHFLREEALPSFKEHKSERDASGSKHNSLDLYIRHISQVPLLKPQDEVELARRVREGDKEARTLMIVANLRLVVKIAHSYTHFGLPLQDLISEGNIGLIKAVERFDPAKGGKLSTYAAWWIKQFIRRALANKGKTIRLPIHAADKIFKMRRAMAKLECDLGREATNEELAHELGMSVYKVAHLKSVSTCPLSLNTPVNEDESMQLGELVCDESALTPFESLGDKSLREDVSVLVSQLTRREAEILRLRFGLDGESPQTLDEVGESLGVTRERVRQIQNGALVKMRNQMRQLAQQRSAEEVERNRAEQRQSEVMHKFVTDSDQTQKYSAVAAWLSFQGARRAV